MTKIEMELYWVKYEKLVKSRTYFYTKKFNLDYDDLYDVGIQMFLLACNTYNNSKSSFCTHLWIKLQGIQDEANRILVRNNRTTELQEVVYLDKDTTSIAETFYEKLKVFLNDCDIAYLKKNPTEKRFKNYLKKHYPNSYIEHWNTCKSIWAKMTC